MSRAKRNGFVLLLNGQGQILELTAGTPLPGTNLWDWLEPGIDNAAESMLCLSERGVAFDCLMLLREDQRQVRLWATSTGEATVLVGTPPDVEPGRTVEALLATLLPIALGLSGLEEGTEGLFTTLSGMNNELNNARRSLAQSNAELQRMVAAERQRSRLLATLHETTAAMLSCPSIDATAALLFDAVLVVLGSDRTAMLLARETERYVVRRARAFPLGAQVELRGLDELTSVAALPSRLSLWHDGQLLNLGIAPLIVRLGSHLDGYGYLVCCAGQEPFTPEEREFVGALAAAASSAIRIKELYAQIHRLSLTDPLTGLNNRRGFEFVAGPTLRASIRYGRPLTVLMLDVDYFKKVNDRYGHESGDAVLRSVAEVLRRSVRAADLVGRWGGEEFVFLLPETATEGAVVLAERIRLRIAEMCTPMNAEEIRVTVSVGVASLAGRDDSLDHMLSAADGALYRAKDEGRNRVVVACG